MTSVYFCPSGLQYDTRPFPHFCSSPLKTPSDCHPSAPPCMSVLPKLNNFPRWGEYFRKEMNRTVAQNLSPQESLGPGWDADTSSYPDAPPPCYIVARRFWRWGGRGGVRTSVVLPTCCPARSTIRVIRVRSAVWWQRQWVCGESMKERSRRLSPCAARRRHGRGGCGKRESGNTCRCEHHRVGVDAEQVLDHPDCGSPFP